MLRTRCTQDSVFFCRTHAGFTCSVTKLTSHITVLWVLTIGTDGVACIWSSLHVIGSRASIAICALTYFSSCGTISAGRRWVGGILTIWTGIYTCIRCSSIKDISRRAGNTFRITGLFCASWAHPMTWVSVIICVVREIVWARANYGASSFSSRVTCIAVVCSGARRACWIS